MRVRKASLKITISDIIVILIYIFAFQRAIQNSVDAFSYFDEIFTVIATLSIIGYVIRERIQREDITILMLCVILLVEGVISNIFSGVLKNSFGIVIDIISVFKIILIFVWSKNLRCNGDLIIQKAASWGRKIVYIMFPCMIISLFVDIGMSYMPRYGINSFPFVFGHAGNFSKFFYFLIPVLTADLSYRVTKKKKIAIVLACIVWVSTLRSRAISFVALYIFLVCISFRKKNKKSKLKWYYLVGPIAIAVFFSWDQLIFYLTTETQARALLLRYSFVTLKDCFPIGSGFGTYGSDVAASIFYSILYQKYGFNSIYGMGLDNGAYLNDNYWPMILGQFGVIGTVLIGWILLIIHYQILRKTKKDKYFSVAAISALLFLLISSVASKSYSEFSSICVFMLLGIMFHCKCLQNDKGVDE